MRQQNTEAGPSNVGKTNPQKSKSRRVPPILANLGSEDDVKSYIEQLVSKRVKRELQQQITES